MFLNFQKFVKINWWLGTGMEGDAVAVGIVDDGEEALEGDVGDRAFVEFDFATGGFDAVENRGKVFAGVEVNQCSALAGEVFHAMDECAACASRGVEGEEGHFFESGSLFGKVAAKDLAVEFLCSVEVVDRDFEPV